MEIIINRNTLVGALAEITPFAPQKSTIQILKFAKIVTKGNRIKFEAHDTQMNVKKYVVAESIDQDGEFLVDADALNKYIAKCKGDTIKLTAENNQLIVKHSKGQAEFETLSTKDYPEFSSATDETTDVVLPSKVLAECISAAKNFVGTDELRPQMKPIYAYFKDGIFGFSATDTRRLINDSFAGFDDMPDISWYIEPTLFSPLVKACKTVDSVKISITSKQVAYRLNDTIIQSVQTAAKYPDVQRVIPKEWNIECAVKKSELLESLNRIVLISAVTRLAKFDFTALDLTISTNNVDMLRSSAEQIQHNGCNGDIKIGFHCDYVADCINACDSDEVHIRMTDPSRPAVFHCPDKPNRTILLMPMTLQNN